MCGVCGGEGEIPCERLVAYEGDNKGIIAVWHIVDGEGSFFIGDGSLHHFACGVVHYDIDVTQWLVAVFVVHSSFHYALRTGEGCFKKQNNQ